MLRCCDCGHSFPADDAGTHVEPHRLDEAIYRERWSACPECGSTDLEEVEPCHICGLPTMNGICRECKKEVREALDDLMEIAPTKDGKEAVLDEIQDYVEGYET